MARIVLVGYGKMGRMIEGMSASYGCEVVSIIDPSFPEAHPELTAESIATADIAIEFTHPGIVMQNIRTACELGLSIVVGTTGWQQHLDEVKAMVQSSGVGLLYGSNFSIGMNLFLRVVENAAREIGRFDEYDVYGFELHHCQKADSPSGTAITITDKLLESSRAKTRPVFDRLERKISREELHFASIRAGAIPGTHTVGFDSEADTIELTHRARNRSGFAMGALKAAKWMLGKKGVFSINEMIEEMLC